MESSKRPMPTKHVPIEIVRNILSRMPVKSVLRFRAVSKHWLSEISNPAFIHLHTATMCLKNEDTVIIHTIHPLIEVNNSKETVKHCFTLHHLKSPQSHPVELGLPCHVGDFFHYARLSIVHLLGSCNGIVGAVAVDERNRQFSYLWNPATRLTNRLESESSVYDSMPGIHDWEKVNVNGWENCMGFGFDLITNDYKFVRIVVEVVLFNIIYVEVYSAKECSWREISLGEDSVIGYDMSLSLNLDSPAHGVCVKGVVYWKAGEDRSSLTPCILTFNLNTEVFKKFFLPENVLAEHNLADQEYPEWQVQFTEFKDSTAVIVHSHDDITLWTIDDDGDDIMRGGSFTKMFTFEALSTIQMVHAYLNTGDFLVETEGNKWFLYDDEHKVAKSVQVPVGTNGVFNYYERLVSIKGMKSVYEKIGR